jgi:hypothetical protein
MILRIETIAHVYTRLSMKLYSLFLLTILHRLLAEDTSPPRLMYGVHENLGYANFTIEHQSVTIQEDMLMTQVVVWKCFSLRPT